MLCSSSPHPGGMGLHCVLIYCNLYHSGLVVCFEVLVVVVIVKHNECIIIYPLQGMRVEKQIIDWKSQYIVQCEIAMLTYTPDYVAGLMVYLVECIHMSEIQIEHIFLRVKKKGIGVRYISFTHHILKRTPLSMRDE